VKDDFVSCFFTDYGKACERSFFIAISAACCLLGWASSPLTFAEDATVSGDVFPLVTQEEQLGTWGKNLAFLQEKKKELQTSLQTHQHTISHLLTGLVMFSQHTPAVLALSSEHPERAVQQVILLRYLVPTLEQKAKELEQQQNRVQEMHHICEEVADILGKKSLSLLQKRQKLQLLLDQHMITVPSSLSQMLKNQIDALADQARSMDEFIAELDAEISKVFRNNASTQELSFKMPVKGNIHAAFGQPIPGTKEISKGILVKTSPGANVIAPASGRVVFAGPFKRYGNIVILDHGNNFHSLVAGLDILKVELGDQVSQGVCLGRMAQKKPPLLVFGLRKSGKPVDPKNFLLKK
jgi:septal ring factor EnvC (AmiA/AmiB activator)